MFDEVPVRAWLLIAILAAAYVPARNLHKYVAHSPSRRDITRPSEDLSWRTPSLLYRNLAILGALLAVSVFMFTPKAAEFARSPALMPILLIAGGAWALYTVPKGIVTGKIEPWVRGINRSYDRTAQPKRFWVSLSWNAILGCFCLWIAFMGNGQEIEDRCYDRQPNSTLEEELSACNQLIRDRGEDDRDFADLVAARGVIYHRMNDADRALADYNDAIYFNPKDSYALYNRALLFSQIGDYTGAIRDYSASLKLRPDNPDALIDRGRLLLDAGKFDDAGADFTRAHELVPPNINALAYRGLSYALKGDRLRAEQDFKAVRASDPANPVLRKGRSILDGK